MKGNKIKIIIADDLTPAEELREISTRLTQKLLAGNGNQVDKKRIGNQIDIKHLTTQITIERVGEKPVELIKCNVCGLEYSSILAKLVWVNYGGKTRTIKTCSDICAQQTISWCGEGRAAIKKKDLKPFRFY